MAYNWTTDHEGKNEPSSEEMKSEFIKTVWSAFVLLDAPNYAVRLVQDMEHKDWDKDDIYEMRSLVLNLIEKRKSQLIRLPCISVKPNE